MALNPRDPDLLALAVTVGHAVELIDRDAPAEHWAALTNALVAEHTPEQLANMLTGAATIIALRGR